MWGGVRVRVLAAPATGKSLRRKKRTNKKDIATVGNVWEKSGMFRDSDGFRGKASSRMRAVHVEKEQLAGVRKTFFNFRRVNGKED